jgi:hypothetical protein
MLGGVLRIGVASDCTERHPPAPAHDIAGHDIAGQGREGTTEGAQP